jgi:hypothetical protein
VEVGAIIDAHKELYQPPALTVARRRRSGRSFDLERIVLMDRQSTYRDGSRAGWSKVKDPSWYARESWRFPRA